MNLLNKLTKKNLLLNKKRTAVTVIGIILSVALITALASLVVSFKESFINYEKQHDGNFHVTFSDVTLDNLKNLKKNRTLDNLYIASELGYAYTESKNEDKPFAYVRALDYTAMDELGFKVIEGRMPKTSKEIVIPRHLKTNGRVFYKVGDTISLTIGNRVSEGEILDQNNPYLKDEEEFLATQEIQYKVVGIIERPSYRIEDFSAPGYTFITCLDKELEGNYTVYVRYKKKYLKDYHETTANILGVDVKLYKDYLSGTIMNDEMTERITNQIKNSKYHVDAFNPTLMMIEGADIADSTFQALYIVAGIITMIIIVTSVFCIRNSFSISITEKTKQYGMLASIGATRKQIKKNVLYEAFILGIIGLPIGIISGETAAFILIKIASYLVGAMLDMEFTFMFSWLAVLLSLVLGSITIYFSAIKSAKKASRISPISAIRSNDDIKINAKKIKAPKIIKKVFGIGGNVSYKNLKRNKKKYRTTVVSIVVCVAVFIALASFMGLAFRVVKYQYGNKEYNISMYFSSEKDEGNKLKKCIDDLKNIDENGRYAIYQTLNLVVSNPRYNQEYLNIFSDQADKEAVFYINAVGDDEYRRYLDELGLNYDDVYNKGILINDTLVYNEKTKKTVAISVFDYQKGDKIVGEYIKDYDKDEYGKLEFEIAHVTDKRPLGLSSLYGLINIIVSDAYLEQYCNTVFYNMYAVVNNPDSYQDEADKVLEALNHYGISNRAKEAREEQSLYMLVSIFLYGFITVIALIGITNIFNTITTNMELRSREFAMLKSIGMTKREFNHMISLESLFYGCKSLLLGIPIGCLLSYLIYQAFMSGDLDFEYRLPLLPIAISIFAVLILITCIMKYSITKINRQNTIDTIRNDNI